MAVAFVADAEVVNGTAGTSVVVSAPAGSDGSFLIAFIAATATPTISTPAGWELIGTQDSATNVRMAAFYRFSDGAASWTWTLGTSQRNFGWVGAYSGVDTSNPIEDSASNADTTAGTSFTSDLVSISRDEVRFVSAVATVRTASGSATTFTEFDIERFDGSTNAGAGTDIAGAVADGPGELTPTQNVFTASQSCTHGAMWSVVLAPAFNAYEGQFFAPIVEAAFGYDQTSDPDTWVWKDITAHVRGDVGVNVTKGAAPESLQSQPSGIRFSLTDPDGNFIPDNPVGLHYPSIVPGCPIRVSVPFGYSPTTERAVAFAESWEPSWDDSVDCPAVDVVAYGRLHELQQNDTPIRSALYRRLTRRSPVTQTLPLAHWSLEEPAGATSFAASMPGIAPLDINGSVTLASASDLPASAPLPVMTSSGFISGGVRPGRSGTYLYKLPTGQWCWLAVVKTPAEPGSAVSLVRFECTGTAQTWSLDVVPGSPATFNVRAYDADGTNVLDDALAVDESTFFDSWLLLSLGVTQVGPNVSYNGSYYYEGSGSGNTGTLASRTIGQATRVRIPAVEALAVGHVTLYVDPEYDFVSEPALTAFTVLDGNTGDLAASDRFAGLCEEEGIPFQIRQASSVLFQMTMGPQGIASLGNLLQETAASDQAQLHDGGSDGDLVFVARARKYNAAATLIIDGEVSPGLAPKRDTASRITDSTVSRSGGSSGRYVAVGAKAPRAEQVTLSLESDAYLVDIAAFRVARGTVDGMRYPQLKFNLRGSPALTRQWLDCAIGSRVQALNVPNRADAVDVFIDGYGEYISGDKWEVTLNCSPAEPFVVGVVEDEELGRADTDGTLLVSAVDADDTALSVVASAGEPWITTAAHGSMFPVDLKMAGERVTLTACSSNFTDLFSGTETNGWGANWTTSGASAANYSVSGGRARQSNDSVNVLRHAFRDTGSSSHRIRTTFTIDTGTVTGAPATKWLFLRAADTSNYAVARVDLETDDSVRLGLHERVAGSLSSLSTEAIILSGFGAGQLITLDGVVFPDGTVWAKAWATATQAEPRQWQVYGLTSLTTGTLAGNGSRLETGNTNALPVQFQWDDFEILTPQTMTVTRSVNGVSKSHAAGTPLSLWTPMRAAL